MKPKQQFTGVVTVLCTGLLIGCSGDSDAIADTAGGIASEVTRTNGASDHGDGHGEHGDPSGHGHGSDSGHGDADHSGGHGHGPVTIAAGSCDDVPDTFEACGGELVGTWSILSSCLVEQGVVNPMATLKGCDSARVGSDLSMVQGSATFLADGTGTIVGTHWGAGTLELSATCLEALGGGKDTAEADCKTVSQGMSRRQDMAWDCTYDAEGCHCTSQTTDPKSTVAMTYSVSETAVTIIADQTWILDYCVTENQMVWTKKHHDDTGATRTIYTVFEKKLTETEGPDDS